MNNNENRTVLKSRLMLVFFGKIFQIDVKMIFLLIFVTTIISVIFNKGINFTYYDLIKFISFLFIIFILLKIENFLNKFCYDAEAIYWKKAAFRVHFLPIVILNKSLRYVDIDNIILNMGELYIPPFSDLELYDVGHRWGEKATFILARGTFFDDDFRIFLQCMYAACSDKYPPELVAFMNNEQKL